MKVSAMQQAGSDRLFWLHKECSMREIAARCQSSLVAKLSRACHSRVCCCERHKDTLAVYLIRRRQNNLFVSAHRNQ